MQISKMKFHHARLLLRCAICYIVLTTSAGTVTTNRRFQIDNNKGSSRTIRQVQDYGTVVFEPDESDNVENPESFIENYSEEEKMCLSEGKFLIAGKCHDLKSTGPCGKDEWLVLDEGDGNLERNQQLHPICKKKPCMGKNEIWWKNSRLCIQKSLAKTNYCRGKGKVIVINAFGEGVCGCTKYHGKLKNGNQCYEYYQRGPCRFNEVITYNIISGYAVCSLDKCLAENRMAARKRPIRTRNVHHIGHYKDVYTGTEPIIDIDVRTYDDGQNKRFKRAAISRKKSYAPMEGVGKCYVLSTVGPCQELGEQSRFVIDPNVHVPRCSSETYKLSSLNPVFICSVDDSNNCRPKVTVIKDTATNHLSFYNQLKKQG